MSDGWKPSYQAVNELGVQVELAGLLQGALASGFLAHCRKPVSGAELAGATGLERGVVDDVCDALRAIGVLVDGEDDADGEGGADGAQHDHVVISDLYAPLLEPGVDHRALNRLAAAGVRAAMLRGLFEKSPTSYWSIDSAARLALASNATADPATEFGRESLVGTVRADAEWDGIFSRGARFLDLGCGVAGGIVSFLHHYPRVTAVGIDIAEDVLDVARSRALALGVADRARFLVADAASFRDPEPFDVVFWPHTFYPEPSRSAALATAFANLRPGGLLVTVNIPPRPPRAAAAGAAIDPLLRKLWGIEERSLEALTTELEEAGFTGITAAAVVPPVLPLIKAYRPE